MTADLNQAEQLWPAAGYGNWKTDGWTANACLVGFNPPAASQGGILVDVGGFLGRVGSAVGSGLATGASWTAVQLQWLGRARNPEDFQAQQHFAGVTNFIDQSTLDQKDFSQGHYGAWVANVGFNAATLGAGGALARGGEVVLRTVAVRSVVVKLLDAATKAEPGLTARVAGHIASSGGHLVGLGNRVKSFQSTAEKISLAVSREGITPAAAAAGIKDANRYTAILPTHGFTSGVRSTLDGLKADGFGVDPANIKNTWTDGSPYKGINAFVQPPGSSRLVEVQFHTPESFGVKQATHGLYEMARSATSTPMQIQQAFDGRVAAAGSIPTPAGVGSIGRVLAPVAP